MLHWPPRPEDVTWIQLAGVTCSFNKVGVDEACCCTSAGDGSDNGESCTGVTCAATGVVNLLADLPLLLASAAAAHDGEELDATR